MSDYSTLSNLLSENIECFVFDCIASTNDYLLSLPATKNTQVCVAREQTAGKGQHNRTWHSTKDSSILLSIRRQLSVKTPLEGLSLVVGLAVVQVLNDLGVQNLMLKWPNDVYFQDKKLAGILLENSAQGEYQSVVIGLGINHHMDQDFTCDAPWTDIARILGRKLNKLDLTYRLIGQIIRTLDIFIEKGFAGFAGVWQALDYLHGKTVLFEKELAVCTGVDAKGFLQVSTSAGIKTVYSSKAFALL